MSKGYAESDVIPHATIPGVLVVTSVQIAFEIDNMGRFKSGTPTV